MKRALIVALVICLAGALAYGVEYVLELREATQPPTPEAFVQAAWTVHRQAPGHRIHVNEEGIECTACHRAADEKQFDEPGPGVCRDCHKEQTAIEHMRAHIDPEGHRTDAGADTMEVTDCIACHGFGPEPDQKPTDCLRCHSQPKGAHPAVVTHAKEACTRCHDVHENRVKPVACETCHELAPQHGNHPPGSSAQCLDCHTAHGKASTAQESCRTCHAPMGEKPVLASATAGEHTCTGCHAPHAFAPRDAQACTSCHDRQHTLKGKGHDRCTACHVPHAVRASVSQQNVCTSCHKNVALRHPMPVTATAQCTSCHDPHPPKPSVVGPEACTSCHREVASSDLTAHAQGVACKGCHVPHDFVKATEGHTSCTTCHAARLKELAKHPGHARCEDCHKSLPHGGITAPAACGSCHTEQQARVHDGHERCTGCHDAHTGARPKDVCATCHAEQTQKLSPKHRPCQRCHEPHAATPTPEVAGCMGCHASAKLFGLHAVTEHRADCTSCHAAHPEQPPAQRDKCLSCHRDRIDHQPAATQCSGCHAFRGPPTPARKP